MTWKWADEILGTLEISHNQKAKKTKKEIRNEKAKNVNETDSYNNNSSNNNLGLAIRPKRLTKKRLEARRLESQVNNRLMAF